MTTGERGEELACRYLKKKGYTVLERNYRTRWGEIDMIAQKGPYVIFVEVKTRAPQALVSPEEAVTKPKQQRLMKTAQEYLLRHPSQLQPRFDVLAVTMGKTGAKVIHYENAFGKGY